MSIVEAPAPLLPDQGASAMVWMVVVLVAVCATVAHAVASRRFGWAVLAVVAAPVAVPAYWVVTVVRARPPAATTATPATRG